MDKPNSQVNIPQGKISQDPFQPLSQPQVLETTPKAPLTELIPQQKTGKKWLIAGLISIVIISLVITGFFVFRNYQLELKQQITQAQPTSTVTQPSPIPSDKGLILEAFDKTISKLDLNLREGEEFRALDVQIEANWALVEATVVDRKTGEATRGEGTIILFKKEQGLWKSAYPGTPLYKSWLDQVPETLVPADLKLLLK